MLNLLLTPRKAWTVHDLIGTLVDTAADSIHSVAPAETPAAEEITALDPADVSTVDDMPETDTIEATAVEFERASEQARRADRGKRVGHGAVRGDRPMAAYGSPEGPWCRAPTSAAVRRRRCTGWG
ncbi:hypothetical protein ABZ471_11485 [Streptomyces sp. NPDC005728]|uniref:hypothetical protein n=1 Tax=Streptomyces sp. NPDC005728 TaxID=3157054 RepID=UPI0033C94DB2